MPRRAATIARTRAQVGQWASEHAPDTLADLMATYMGPDRRIARMHPDLVEQALSFAIVATTTSGDTLVDRYRDLGLSHPRAIRDALETFAGRRFTALRVNEVELDRGLHVRDIVADELLFLREVSGTHTAQPGMWLLGAIGRIDGRWELLGDARALSRRATIRVVQGLLQPEQPEVRAMEAYHRSFRKPRLENSDGDLLRPVDLVVACTWAETLEMAQRWDDASIHDATLTILGEPEPRMGRPVRASLSPRGDHVAISVNSTPREKDVLDRLGRPEVLKRDDLSSRLPPNDPDGEPTVADHYEMALPEPADPIAHFEAQRAEAWPDEPIPALDDQTPRDALAAGRIAEVRALAPDEALEALGLPL